MVPLRRLRALLPTRLLAAVVCASTPGASALYPAAEGCVNDLLSAIDDIVNGAYDIVQAASDCTLPGLSELSCASDLTDMMSYWFNTGNVISVSTLECGSLDNACAADITQALGDVTDVSNNLVAAVSDCISSPFLCTYDVVTTVDALNGFVSDVIGAIGDCNTGASVPGPLELNYFFKSQNDFRGQRRLQATPSAGADMVAATAQEKDEAAQVLLAQQQPSSEQVARNSTAAAPARVASPTKGTLLSPSTVEKLEKMQKFVVDLRGRLKAWRANESTHKPPGEGPVVV